ncbi:D-alanyl-D-alanine carboxypeptidase [Nonomuraea thailandensis]|uniref:D-alanyl-D-alanine carboxypeptidase n=1 Tax=Nonomuraea thailandensis TaxID=1188745 RepID=A0A9X2JYE8_9ACTN|nr:serine hydrolase domain-containing protein [Nonomuraea thailandensis]MCP2353738.1 D-alanyl-D-alanine carboxypeptidase [Nonomuraea thailandensis]
MAGLAIALAGLPAAAAEQAPYQMELDAVVRAGAVNASAEVVSAGARWQGSSGVRDLRTERPAPVNGRVRIGSTTKTFVATVLLQLVGEGRLRLEDSVERYLPQLVPNGDAITVRQLLSHTSGLFDYLEDQQAVPLTGAAFLKQTRFRTFKPHELVKIATRHEPYFRPGASFRYSNTGYVLAGLLIGKVTGRPYGEEIERRILRPLGLTQTTVPGTSTAVPGPHPHGYLTLGSGDSVEKVDVTRLNPSWAFSAGEMISTPRDLNRFFQALLGGKLLGPAQLQTMRTAVAIDPQGVAYGMGLWSQTRPCGAKVWGHGGRLPGYKTTVLRSDDGERALTLAYSPSTANGVPEFLASEELIDKVFCGKR